MSIDLKLFSDSENNTRALKLAEQVCKLKTFSETAAFYPYVTAKAAIRSAKIVVKTKTGEYQLEGISDARRRNYRLGITVVTEEYIAGIFAEILRLNGIEDFTKQWGYYIADYIYAEVPGSPEKVFELIKEVSLEFKMVSLPNKSRILTLKIIDAWQKDFKVNKRWCNAFASYNLTRSREVNLAFKEAVNFPMQRVNGNLSLKRFLTAKDAEIMMYWCIATKVSPLRLLNYVGYWLTHKARQPREFALENPLTQQQEVAAVYQGSRLGYEPAKPKFSAGFIVKFIGLIMGISWFNDKGVQVEVLTEEMYGFAQCFELEDFAMLGGLEWREMPLSIASCDYYASTLPRTINKITEREVTATQAGKLRAPKRVKVRKITPTGNLLFDAEMLEDD